MWSSIIIKFGRFLDSCRQTPGARLNYLRRPSKHAESQIIRGISLRVKRVDGHDEAPIYFRSYSDRPLRMRLFLAPVMEVLRSERGSCGYPFFSSRRLFFPFLFSPLLSSPLLSITLLILLLISHEWAKSWSFEDSTKLVSFRFISFRQRFLLFDGNCFFFFLSSLKASKYSIFI